MNGKPYPGIQTVKPSILEISLPLRGTSPYKRFLPNLKLGKSPRSAQSHKVY